jgi:hypothetical protein
LNDERSRKSGSSNSIKRSTEKPLINVNQYLISFGDPTVIGWLITIAYFISAFLCWRAGQAHRKTHPRGRRLSQDLFLWVGIALLLILLGINKQLDLQLLIRDVGREIAEKNSWYGRRREVQTVFMGFIGILGVLAVSAFIWWMRGRIREFRLVILGLMMLIAFVLIRAASFNHVEYFLDRWAMIGPLEMKYAVELGGVVLIGIGAVRKGREA